MTPRLIAFAGSTREGSYNRTILEYAVQGARDAGAQVTVIDLREYSLPVYNAESEAATGIPEAALRLQDLFAKAHGVLIASPEYNGFFPALLKTTLDWVSRPRADGSHGLECLRGKVAGVMAASPGPLGGVRSLPMLRLQLELLGMMVVPRQVGVGSVHTQLKDGRLSEEKTVQSLRLIGADVTTAAAKLHG